MLKTETLTPMQLGRLNAALDQQFRWSDGAIYSLRAKIEKLVATGEAFKNESDRMIDWNRTRFNRMDGRQQEAYEARLKAGRYYWIGQGDLSWRIPKIVFDVLDIPAKI